MGGTFKTVVSVVSLSLVASIASTLLNRYSAALWFGAPAAIFTGWAALGHLVTLDDDSPGGWSNPEGSKAVWHQSIGELAAKGVVFAVVLALVVLWPMARQGA